MRHGLFLMLLATPGIALAWTPGKPYWMVSAGYVESDFDKPKTGDLVTDVKGGAVAQLGIGIPVDEFVSFELNYMHLAKQKVESRGFTDQGFYDGEAEYVSNGIGPAVVLRYPLIERVHLLLRGDYTYFKTDLDSKFTMDGTPYSGSLDDSAWQAGFGLGAEYAVDADTSVKGMWQQFRFDNKVGGQNLRHDENIFTLGLMRSF